MPEVTPELARYAVVGLIILLTHFQAGITGFGANALALPFVTLLIGLDQAVPVLVVQAFLLSILMLLESRGHIAWREFGRMIGLAAVGLPIGMWAATALPEDHLRWVLAGFMMLMGVQGLLRERQMTRGAACPHAASLDCGREDTPAHATAPLWATLLLPVGGIIQGAFGSGGPPIVVYAARALTHKTVFRATLNMLWIVLNTMMIAGFIAGGRLNSHLLGLNLAYVPATLVGMWLGTHAHYRINEHAFRQFVYAMLLVSGIVLGWSLL